MTDDIGLIENNHVEEDENYFVSMTDMMVGVLFIFIILLMVFALNFRQQTDTSEDRIKRLEAVEQQAEQATTKLTQLQQQVRDSIETIRQSSDVRRQMLDEIKSALAKKGIDVEISASSDVLRLRDKAVHFDLNVATLSDEARTNLAAIADVLDDVLPRYTGASATSAAKIETVFLEGHTDSTGLLNANWPLSTNRAVNTYIGLTEDRPALKALTNSNGQQIISVSGYGSTRPIPGLSEGDDAQRRIDLRFVMEAEDQKNLQQVQSAADQMKQELEDLSEAVKLARSEASAK